MIEKPDDFFDKGCGRCDRFDTPECSTRAWNSGLRELRRICLDAGLKETAKWGHPCYMHADRNIALVGAFRNDFRLTFFNASLMGDPDGLMEPKGPNTEHPDIIRFTSNEEVEARKDSLRSYLAEAMGYAEKGVLPEKKPTTLQLPDELAEALDDDPELAEAFHDLTPGRQKSYVIALISAKKPETRRNRIAKFRDKILAGKGATDR